MESSNISSKTSKFIIYPYAQKITLKYKRVSLKISFISLGFIFPFLPPAKTNCVTIMTQHNNHSARAVIIVTIEQIIKHRLFFPIKVVTKETLKRNEAT